MYSHKYLFHHLRKFTFVTLHLHTFVFSSIISIMIMSNLISLNVCTEININAIKIFKD